MRILIVEDDEPSRVFLQRVLERAGYEVRAAEDGLEAWDILEKDEIRLLVTDWIMPRMGGLELCQKVRERPNAGYVFIIIVTAKDSKSDIVKAMDAGADDYITKPFDKGELLARVRAGWRIISLEQELSEKNEELLKANTIMKNDLAAASRLQRSFLPRAAPKIPGLRFSWFFEPCEMVGGDTFNFFPLDEEHVALYVLDVSGHGVPAAMLSVMLTRIMTPDSGRGGLLAQGIDESPRSISRLLNRRFPMNEEVGQYFTLLYATIHLPSLTLKMVQAGHPYLLQMHKDGGILAIQEPGFPIGMFEDADFDEETIPLSSGDCIFLYSDGIVEAANQGGEFYGLDRLMASVSARRDRRVSEITTGILTDVLAFTGGAKIMDDMTLIGVAID